MSPLRRSSRDTRALEAAIDTLTIDGAAPATVEPLSDLSIPEAHIFREQWNSWPLKLRRDIVSSMASLASEDLRLNFERALTATLIDSEPEIRLAAVEALWEAESTSLLAALLKQVSVECDQRVQRALIVALGRFSKLAGEGQVPDELTLQIEQTLIGFAVNDTDEIIRLEATAAAAYLGPTSIEEHISGNYDNGHGDAREMSLVAMGRYGGQQWSSRVIDALRVGDSDVRVAAAGAAPYVEDRRVIPFLYEAAEDELTDLQLAALRALGEIGGKEVRSFLEGIRDSTEGDVSLAAEDALANASLLDGASESGLI